MERLAAVRLWLERCMWGVMAMAGAAQATPPADVVINTPAQAQAFKDSTPFVFEGQSLIVHSSFTTDRGIELQRLAPVIVGPDTFFALAGVVSSAAAPMSVPLEKRGTGMLALTGNNRYTSNTVLREGTLRLGGDSPLGEGPYNLEQHAGTALHLEQGVQLRNFIHVIDARPGDQSLPGLAGVAQWQVDAGSATLLNTVNSQVPLRKTGGGTLRLAGALQGHQSLDVQAGALAVDGAAAARVMVTAGARLEGHGELMQAHIRNGGMLAPGGRDAVGTLGIWGNVIFDADSLYHVNTQPDGRADLLRVGGTAGLDGRVWAEAGAGQWRAEHRYLILSADGGLGDTRFVGVDTNLAFLDPELEYDAHNVYLALHRNDLGAGDVGEAPDEKEVGDAIDPPGGSTKPLTPLQEATRNMSVDQVRTVLRQSSGSWHASVRSFLLDDGRYVRQAVLASGADAWNPPAGTPGDGSQSVAPHGLRTWGQSYAATGHRQAVGGVAGDRHHGQGVVMGMDAPAGAHWRPGVVLAAQQARLSDSQGLASANMDSLHAGMSVHGRWDGMRVTLALLRAWHRIDSRRYVSAGDLQEGLRSTYAGRSWHAVMELAPHLRKLDAWREWLRQGLAAGVADGNDGMAPYLRHEWARLSLPGHTENGGLSAHGVDASSTGLHVTTLGWRLRHEREWQGRPAWLEADLGWRHAWGSVQPASTQHFAGEARSGQPQLRFTSQGQPLPRNALAATLSAGMAPWRDARLSLRYAGLYGGGQRAHAAWADMRWRF